MNIFLINHYAGSPKLGMEFRPYYLAKEWIKLGHNVTILAANNSHLRNINPEINSAIKEEIIEGIKYIWVKTPKYSGNGIGRIMNMFSFIKKTLHKSKYFSKKYKPDVVIASSTYPSDNYVAKKIAKYSNAKYIFEVHDLWPLSPMEIGKMSKFHPFIFLMQHGEHFAYKKCDAVISMLPKTKEHMKYHGLDLKKWNYVPNGILVKEWYNNEKLNKHHNNILNNLKLQNKTIIAYAGGYTYADSLDTVIESAKILRNNKKLVFVFVGKGNEENSLKKQAKGFSNIIFLEAIPKTQIPDLLKMADILVIAWKKNPLYRFGISPNKIFDYMMAAKPIIHATDAPNNFVDNAKCGIATEPENPQKFAKAILKLQNKTKEELRKMGENGQNYVLMNYDYKVLSEKFITIVENI